MARGDPVVKVTDVSRGCGPRGLQHHELRQRQYPGGTFAPCGGSLRRRAVAAAPHEPCRLAVHRQVVLRLISRDIARMTCQREMRVVSE